MANVALPTNAVDLGGLSDLRRRAERDDPTALADVAVQFEALFIGMMLESARSASLGSGLFDGAETEQYLALMDRQVALELARQGGFGFGKMLTEQLAPRDGTQAVNVPGPPHSAVGERTGTPGIAKTAEFPSALPKSLATLGGAPSRDGSEGPTPAEFVTAMLPEAKAAADALGIEPRLLLAQAALETGWGRSMPHEDGASSHNLFGIKAGAGWDGPAASHLTLEHENGVTAPRYQSFRTYASAAESFGDYVHLISSAQRYAGALEHGGSAEAYARGLTEAGYATDPAYADKWLAIYNGDRLAQALRGIDVP
jgi:flagellar protein FlgJ